MTSQARLSHDRPGAGTWEAPLQAVPTSLTAVASIQAWLYQVHVNNTTGGAITFTLQDAQGTPVAGLSAVSIAANQAYVMAWPVGLPMNGGFGVTSGGAGLTFSAVWRQ